MVHAPHLHAPLLRLTRKPSAALPSRMTVTSTTSPTLLARSASVKSYRLMMGLPPNCTSTSPALRPALAAGESGLHVAEAHAVFRLAEIGDRAEIGPVAATAATPLCDARVRIVVFDHGDESRPPRRPRQARSATLPTRSSRRAASGALILSQVSEGLW